MTAQIPQMMSAEAGTAALRADPAGPYAHSAPDADHFAGMMSRFGGPPATRDGSAFPPAGDGLPEGGQILPEDQPLTEGEDSALFGLSLSLADLEAMPPPLRAALTIALREASAGQPLTEEAVARAMQSLTSPHAGLTALAAEADARAEAARQAMLSAAQSPEWLAARNESAGQLQGMSPVIPPQAAAAQAAMTKAEATALLSQPGALATLSGLVDAAESGASPHAPTLSPASSLMSPGLDRALPGWTLATPLHQSQQWSEEVGQRIRWMVGNQVQAAELRINPPQLGPIEVRISMQNDQMNVSFLAQQGQVRDALEDAIPRLREMLGQQGFASVNVDVSGHSARHDGDAEADGHGPVDGAVSGAGTEPGGQGGDDGWRMSSTRGLIDTYA